MSLANFKRENGSLEPGLRNERVAETKLKWGPARSFDRFVEDRHQVEFQIHRRVSFRRGPFRKDDELDEITRKVDELDTESLEEGYPACDPQAKASARRIVQDIWPLHPHDYEVYPTADREVAILASGGHGRAVLILCDSEGGAACFVTHHGKNRRSRYDDAALLPDSFVFEALREIL